MGPSTHAIDSPAHVRRGILSSYRSMRGALAAVGIALPILLWAGGHLGGLELQGSMSAYYHANVAKVEGLGSMRDVFVGGLFAVAVLMYSYKGLSLSEEVALDVGAMCALGVALVPTAPGWVPHPDAVTVHGAFAVAFFLCIAFVCVFCASDTLGLVDDPKARARYRKTYFVLGALMVALPLLIWILRPSELPKEAANLFERTWVFWLEVAGIYVFAAYWIVKGRETSRSRFDEKLVRGSLKLKQPSLGERLRFNTCSVAVAGDEE